MEAVRRAIDFVCVLSYVNLLEPKQILREEGCDVAVLSINDVGGDRVIWERMVVRLAWACGVSEDTQSMSYMCVYIYGVHVCMCVICLCKRDAHARTAIACSMTPSPAGRSSPS